MPKKRLGRPNEGNKTRTCAAIEWQPKPYKPEYCVDLIDIMRGGRGIEHFNAEKFISRNTFYVWLKENPDFRYAYEIAKELAKKHMFALLQEYQIEEQAGPEQAPGPRLNMKIWSAIMKYSHQAPDQRMLEIPGLGNGDVKGQMSLVLEAVGDGRITTEEAHRLAQILDTSQKITETSELSEKVEALEAALVSGVKIDEFKEE